jgi:hypothetical protein
MKTLLTLFNKDRNFLETEIERATNLKQVVGVVQSRLDTLERNYISELSVSQVRLVRSFLDTLRQSLTALTAADEANLSSNLEQAIAGAKQASPNKLVLKGLQGLISLGIIGSLFTIVDDTATAWMDILLMFVLVGLELSGQFEKDNLSNNLDIQTTALQPAVQVDRKFLLDNLADALSTIDRAVAQSEAQKPLASGGIEDMPEMLDFLQKLWGASFLGNPIVALEISKMVPQILIEQGIRVQNYQPQEAQNQREYFEFEPSIDPEIKDYVTLTPALLKGDRLLRPGRVIEPAAAESKN